MVNFRDAYLVFSKNGQFLGKFILKTEGKESEPSKWYFAPHTDGMKDNI